MSIAAVRDYFAQFGMADNVLEFSTSSATVELAAQAAGVIPARIAKSLSFKVDGKAILIITAGDAKVDNSRYKAQFHTKAKMLTHEEAHELIGHDVGGVCPFALPEDVKVTTYDGRAFLQAVDTTYDVIMVDAYQDITIPFQMSSVEFFTMVKDHLKDGGVMVVNMNMHGNKEGDINQYLADTIANVFDNIKITYYNANGGG